MMRKLCLLLCFMSINLWGQHAYAVTCTVGIVPQFHHDKLFKIWRPILKSLEEKTECEFIWKRNKDIPDFEKNLFDGEYDFVYANPWHVVQANKYLGYLPLVSSGTKQLRGILVVPKDGEYDEVSKLEGKRIAFPAPNAFAASLVIRAVLVKSFGIYIRPVFMGSHSDVYAAVAKKDVIAGGGGVMGTYEKQSPEMLERLKILYTSEGFKPHAFIVNPRVEEELQEGVRRALLEIALEKPKLFEAIPMPDPIVVTIDDYDKIKKLNLEQFVLQAESKD